MKTITTEDFNRALRVSQRMIEKQEHDLNYAIEKGDWKEAFSTKTYIDGMQQILVVFEIAAKEQETA